LKKVTSLRKNQITTNDNQIIGIDLFQKEYSFYDEEETSISNY
jgi:hypothetical protein